MMGTEGGMFFGGGFMWLLWLLIFVVIFVVVKTSLTGGAGGGRLDTDTPMEILKKRYARGEIDEEEFKRRRKELGD